MDSSSICASAVGIFVAAGQLYELLKTFPEPSEEICDLQSELSELETVFQLVQISMSNVSQLSPTQIVAVSKALVKTADLQCFLQPILKAAGENVERTHYQWIRDKSNVERLREQFRSIRREMTILVIPQSSRLFEEWPFRIQSPRGCPLRIGGITRGFSNRSSADDCLQMQRSTKRTFPGLSRSLRPCYVLIFLAFLTIVGSLVPALWRSISQNDISGGFALAQYILGVGVFVIGCAVAIHSRTCICWSSSSRADSPTQSRSLELEAITNIRNVRPHELRG